MLPMRTDVQAEVFPFAAGRAQAVTIPMYAWLTRPASEGVVAQPEVGPGESDRDEGDDESVLRELPE